MIVGIGTDLAEISRFSRALARHTPAKIAQRFLAESEVSAFLQASDPARFLAKNFAAKEALAKASGHGVRPPLALNAIAVQRDALGRPFFEFSPVLAAWFQARGVQSSHLSLSDEAGLVLAFVVLESN